MNTEAKTREFVDLVMLLREKGAVTDTELTSELEIEPSALPRLLSGELDASAILPSARELSTSGRIDRKRWVTTTYMGAGGRSYSATLPSTRTLAARAEVVTELVRYIASAAERSSDDVQRFVVFHVTFAAGHHFSTPEYEASSLHARISGMDATNLLDWLSDQWTARYSRTGAVGRAVVRAIQMTIFVKPAA